MNLAATLTLEDMPAKSAGAASTDGFYGSTMMNG